jgi:hypothetical protein
MQEATIGKSRVLLIKSNHQVIFFLHVLLSDAILSKNRKYEDENRGFKTEWEEEVKTYFVLKI